jgi:hypothetical protein
VFAGFVSEPADNHNRHPSLCSYRLINSRRIKDVVNQRFTDQPYIGVIPVAAYIGFRTGSHTGDSCPGSAGRQQKKNRPENTKKISHTTILDK